MNLLNGAQRNLSLRTATVTIRTLTIDNKQMTLAVFRQLPELGRLIVDNKLDNEISLWGIVRYKIKDGDDSTDVWVVAEEDGTLYRAAYPDHMSFDHDISWQIDYLTLLNSAIKDIKNIQNQASYFKIYDRFDERIKEGKIIEIIQQGKEPHFMYRHDFKPIDKLEKELQRIYQSIEKDYNKKLIENNHRQELREIFEPLPQLFIAV